MVVLVTGASGQVGQALQFIAPIYSDIQFVFCNSKQLDITNLNNIKQLFEQFKPDFCINTAAYTAVDKAESEPEKAHLINVEGAKNVAEICKEFNTVLLHVSTDFVFDGTKTVPYTEEDVPNPTSVYGQTKLDGEKSIQETWHKYFIIRTSWVYSQFGNNFMKTMLRLASERDKLSVVNDQVGTPTNAVDLAEALVKVCTSIFHLPSSNLFGIYNFSNEGQASWYDFAEKIFEYNNINIQLEPIPTKSYPTPAKRPAYSVLNKRKLTNKFGFEIRNWESALRSII